MKFTQNFGWNFLILAVFTLLNIIALRYVLADIGPEIDLLSLLTPIHFIAYGLGIYRLADIITEEKVTDGVRAIFEDETTQEGKTIRTPMRGGLRGAIADLIHCPSCTGVWVAMVSFYMYLFFPTIVSTLMIIMALSAMERLTAKVYNLLEALAKKS